MELLNKKLGQNEIEPMREKERESQTERIATLTS